MSVQVFAYLRKHVCLYSGALQLPQRCPGEALVQNVQRLLFREGMLTQESLPGPAVFLLAHWSHSLLC